VTSLLFRTIVCGNREDHMRSVGTILATIGAIGFLAAAFLMPTTVETGLYGGAVANIALQQQQMLAAIGTATLFLAGVILHAAGAIRGPAETAPLIEDEATIARMGITRGEDGYRWAGGLYPTFAAAAKDARSAS
jgi:hypothetical protein